MPRIEVFLLEPGNLRISEGRFEMNRQNRLGTFPRSRPSLAGLHVLHGIERISYDILCRLVVCVRSENMQHAVHVFFGTMPCVLYTPRRRLCQSSHVAHSA